jgi:hypothetical protein
MSQLTIGISLYIRPMIYASAAYRTINNTTAVVVFDRDYAVYGPYLVDGWRGEPFDGLSTDEFLFAFCAFKSEGGTISANEHHFRTRNHGDDPAPECIGYFFNQTKVRATFNLSTLDRMLRNIGGKAVVREFVKDNFQSAWAVAKATGQHSMNQVAKELNVTFDEVESAIVG